MSKKDIIPILAVDGNVNILPDWQRIYFYFEFCAFKNKIRQ